MTVGLVIVSHSARIAAGVVELAGQMAPDVRIVAAGGTDDDGLGTSFEKIASAIARAQSGDGVAVFCDLGSAILASETAVEFLDEVARAGVQIVDAPIVEGAVASAVAAQTGASLETVTGAARARRGRRRSPGTGRSVETVASARVALRNPSGLHARPAAELVKLARRYDSAVTVDGVDTKSLLALLALGKRTGAELVIEASGPDAGEAVAAIVALVEGGFGE